MLSTKIDNKKITLNNAEKLVEDIVSETINKEEAKNMYNSIADEENIIINSSRTIKARTKMAGIFRQLREIFVRSKTEMKQIVMKQMIKNHILQICLI